MTKKHHHHDISWLKWLVALALLAAVILVASKFSEREQFEEIIKNAKLSWVWVGVVLQVGTYVAQALVYRLFLRKSHEALPFGQLLGLSVAEISISQVLPSAGASGSIFLADAFKHHGVNETTIGATILGSVLAYYIAYILSVLVSLIILYVKHDLHPVLLWGGVAFLVFALGVCAFLYRVARRGFPRQDPFIERFKVGRTLIGIFGGLHAKEWLTPRLITLAILLQLSVFVLDSLTLWAMLLAIGSDLAMPEVFTALVLASLARTLGMVPGGLGTFEAAAISSLALFGIPVASGLAATLLFRLLSFWIPMIPGLLFARHESKETPPSKNTPQIPRDNVA